jgi:hypothetical protein
VAELDFFATDLLEEAKRFLEKGRDSSDPAAQAAHLHAALMLSLCALEAHINAIGEEFSNQPSLSPHEKGILLERDVRLEGGEFRVTQFLRIVRLEDRIDFLYAKFSGHSPDRASTSWRGRLSEAIDLRNQLTHARTVPSIGESAVQRALQAIIDTLDELYKAIYKRPLPSASRGVVSRLTF